MALAVYVLSGIVIALAFVLVNLWIELQHYRRRCARLLEIAADETALRVKTDEALARALGYTPFRLPD